MRLHDFTTLTFDCYGTLIDWEAGILAAARPWLDAKGVTADDEAVLAAFAKSEAAQEAANPAMLYPDILAAVHTDMARAFGVAADAEAARRFGQSVGDWPAFPDSPAALAYLKRHFRLVILSNVDRASIARSIARLGVDFDAVFTAQDIGAYKPSPRNFDYLLAHVGVPKTQVLHVAQSLFHDHVPAARAGLTGAWIDRRAGKAGGGATPVPAEVPTPAFTFRTLEELAAAHRAEA